MAQHKQVQVKTEGLDMINQGRSANYKPNIWKYEFVQALNNEYDEKIHKRREEKLKEDLKRIIVEADSLLVKLEMIDNIMKLGLESQFGKEIKEGLDTMALLINHNNQLFCDDLYATALCFRLLRQCGCQVSQDIFNRFIDEKGLFTVGLHDNIHGMLELYEASHFGFEDRNLVEKAKTFLMVDFMKMSPNFDNKLANKIMHAMELPMHMRVQWFDIKRQISLYNEGETINPTLIELAKLNFNRLQAKHQEELREVSRWWRNLGLTQNLSFARDRSVESFLWSVGIASDYQFGPLRKALTKAINLIIILDDVYDIYGSQDELQQFSNAIDRWDSKEIEQLPDCFKHCFDALCNITNEAASEIQKEKGWKCVLPYLKKAWATFCKSLLVEAKWYHEGHTPSLGEYLSNAWISSSGPVLCIHAFLYIVEDLTDEVVDFLENKQDLVYYLSIIIRLCNDLATSKAEMERGDSPSSILCYMQEAHVPEETARRHIRGLISQMWLKLNTQLMTQSPSVQQIVKTSSNIARVAYCTYQYGDGCGVQDRETRVQILSTLVEPLKLT